MIKYLLSLIFLLSVTAASAQRNIVESLQTDRPGQGKVTVHQDAGITALIGSRYVKATATEAQRTLKSRGFRVQVYAGNNSRQARNEPVYTYFQPPRWLCRVGDFKSIEEAHVAMRKLKSTGNFKEVAIVREQINIPIE